MWTVVRLSNLVFGLAEDCQKAENDHKKHKWRKIKLVLHNDDLQNGYNHSYAESFAMISRIVGLSR